MMATERRFTITELLVVVAVIAILAAAILPSLARSREKARFVRWNAYNASLNNDTDVVVNYNFQTMNYVTRVGQVGMAALRNGAAACDIMEFEPTDYDGILRNKPYMEWRQGRYLEKHALQFDGRSTYVESLGYPGIDFDPLGDNFTIMAWVYFDRLSLQETLFGKGTLDTTQYDMTRDGSQLMADVGESDSPVSRGGLAAGKWYHVALRVEAGKYTMYLNGQPVGSGTSGAEVSDYNLVLGAAPYEEVTTNPGKGKGKGKPKNDNHPSGKAYGWGKTKNPKGVTVVSATDFFQGRMDEFVVFKEAIHEQAIYDHYRMGQP